LYYGNKTEWSSVVNEIINDKIGWTSSRGPLLSITSLITNRNGRYEGQEGALVAVFLGLKNQWAYPQTVAI